jgi:hypothetical protein
MKKITIAIIIILTLLSIIYYSYIWERKQKVIFLETVCSNLILNTDRLEINKKLSDYYIKSLPSVDENQIKVFYGMSKSGFDPFCVVTYDKDNKLINSGFSFD